MPSLNNNHFGCEGAAAIGRNLQHLRSLETLTYVSPGPAARVVHVAIVTKHVAPSQPMLLVCMLPVVLLTQVSSWCLLCCRSLNSNSIGAAGVAAIGDALRFLPKLGTLKYEARLQPLTYRVASRFVAGPKDFQPTTISLVLMHSVPGLVPLTGSMTTTSEALERQH